MSLLPPDEAGVSKAAATLREGQLVAMPTETVYGLAGNATAPHAVARIYAIKGRPQFNPLIAHVLDLEAAQREGVFSEVALALAQAFWPGPLTLVVPRSDRASVCDLACAGLASIALRAPDHPVARALLSAVPFPLAAPSANRSGKTSPTTPAHVESEFGTALPILQGGPCRTGIESTIIAVMPDAPPRLLRPGALARDAIEALVGHLASAKGEAITAPGMLASHYAPRAAVRLNATSPVADEAFLGFGTNTLPGWPSLSPAGDLQEAAANLYAMLRTLDAQGHAGIAIAPIPNAGLGEAINDRLARASAPR